MKRHAYLIMAHNNLEILEKLLILLDDERNDIYLHVDKRYRSEAFEQLAGRVTRSNCVLVPSKRVNWGGYSLFDCELHLLKCAIQKQYMYYHLLSGVDLPLYNQNIIHCFFRINEGKQFVSLYIDIEERDIPRVKYYHFFRNLIHMHNPTIRNRVLLKLEDISLWIQKCIGVDRIRNRQVCKNANWFSITHEFARYIIDQEKTIRRLFCFTLHADEFVLAYLLMNSPFCDNVYPAGYMRYIDWNRGDPYTWRSCDYEELYKSTKLFARKFDYKTDMDIVNRIYLNITNKK